MCIQLKPLFSRHKGIGVQFTDEPTGNLDTQNAMEVMLMLQRCSKNYKQTIIMVTHNEELAQMCNRIICLSDGRIVEGE